MNPPLENYLLDTGHIYAVIGGTHLGPASDERKAKKIDAPKAVDIERNGVSSCAGLKRGRLSSKITAKKEQTI
jgi:metal-dependent hydrolase (beta-lactamase superfamily II)